MATDKLPPIGTEMWFVCENLYYIPNHAGPILEYVVCSGEVTDYFTRSYTEIRLTGISPKGFPTPYHYPTKEVGKKLFYSRCDAARYAQTLTEKYETAWAWLGSPDIPMRRTWTEYLSEIDAI